MKSFVKLVFIALVLTSFASADFSYFQTDEELKLCACSESIQELVIKNSDSKAVRFDLYTESDLALFSEDIFILAPGDIKTIYMKVKAPCEVVNDEEIIINIKTSAGDDRDILYLLDTTRCQNLRTGLASDTSYIEPCQDINYQVLIENTGPFEEIYTIVSEDANIDEEITLAAGKSALMNASFAPECSIYGNQSNEFLITATKNGLFKTLTHNFEIEQKYDYNVNIAEEYFTCIEGPQTYTVEIENEEDFNNTFNLKLDGPSILKLSNSTIMNSGDVELLYQNPKIGEYNFTLTSISEIGDIEKTYEFNLKIADCYDLQFELSPDEFCSVGKDIQVTFTNNGEFTEELILESNQDWWVDMPEELTLDPLESANITLGLYPPDESQTYEFLLTATFGDQVVERSTTYDVVDMWSCTKTMVEDSVSIRKDKEHEASLTAKNIGLWIADYDVRISPEAWLELKTEELSFAPGETEEIYLEADIDDVPFGSYPFNIELQTGDHIYLTQVTVHIKDKPFYVKTGIFLWNNPCAMASTVLALLAIAGFIVFFSLKKKRGKLWDIFYVSLWLSIILVFVMISITIPLTVEEQPVSNDTYIYLEQGDNYTMPLSEFVFDPDADELVLSILDEDEKNIQLDMIDDTIVLEPIDDWYGNETVIIVATDSEDAYTYSPEFTFEVKKIKDYTISEYALLICPYINILFVFLLLFSINAIFYKKLRGKR